MFKDLCRQNRSCRGYDTSLKVTEEQLREMVDCTRYTASSMNLQPIKYKAVCDEETIKKVLPMLKFGGALPQLHLPFAGTEPTAFIVVCLDREIHSTPELFHIDVGIAAQTILLQATEMGLGGCMLTSFKKEIADILGLKDTLVPALVIALGKPNEKFVIVDAKEGEPLKYYRDEENTHYVPKRTLEEILL